MSLDISSRHYPCITEREFHGLDQDFVIEYCEDSLNNKEYIPAVAATSALFPSFNFDMLKAMVEEMNRYNQSPSEVLEFLNVRLDGGAREKFNVKLIIDGGKQERAMKSWSGSPMSQVIAIFAYAKDRDDEEKRYLFSAKNLQKLDPKTRVYNFKNEAGEVLILTPAPANKFSLNYDTLASTALTNTSTKDVTYDDVSETEEEKYAAMMNSGYDYETFF